MVKSVQAAKSRKRARQRRRASRGVRRPGLFRPRGDGCAVVAGRAHLAARPQESVAALSKALGLTLPTKPKTSAAKAGRLAFWLGPDEWMVIDEGGKDPLADCAKVKALHSAVGISHRNVAIGVTGPACEAAVSAGCPQDLSLAAFPVGAVSRTVLGKAEIVLYRAAEDSFRVECWRSFSDYVFAFLSEAARDAAA